MATLFRIYKAVTPPRRYGARGDEILPAFRSFFRTIQSRIHRAFCPRDLRRGSTDGQPNQDGEQNAVRGPPIDGMSRSDRTRGVPPRDLHHQLNISLSGIIVVSKTLWDFIFTFHESL